MEKRIGVFVCHCGTNIAGVVDVKRVAEELAKYPGVAYSTDYTYMCSDPGQNMVKDAIKKHKLDAVIVAACSPTLHEVTFRLDELLQLFRVGRTGEPEEGVEC